MKRTTLMLSNGTLAALKRLASKRGQALSTVANELLAEGLRRACAIKEHTVFLPVFDMGQPSVNIADRNELSRVLSDQ
jgi:hypothetical protein